MLVAEIFVGSKKIVLCCLYHPPSSDHGINYAFIDECCSAMRLLWDLACPIITCGDFNLNVLNPLKLNYISHFIDSMLEVGLWPLITTPTKYNPENACTKYSLIDQFWVSSPALAVDAFVIPVGITDHFPVVACFELSSGRGCLRRPVRMFNHANNLKFTELLLQIALLVIDDDVDHTFDTYYDNLFNMYDSSYPITEKVVNAVKNNEWLTPRVKACIRKKSKLYNLFICGHIAKLDYTYYANRLTLLLRKVKRLYFYKLFHNVFGDSSKTWFNINKLMGNGCNHIMEKLTVDSKPLKDEEMVNYANDFFVNIALNLTRNIPVSGQYVFYKPPNPHSFMIEPTDSVEVETVIKRLKNKGNVILDLSVQSLKNNARLLSPHIMIIYNLSIEKHCFPKRLKVARILPGYKSGSKDIIDNYRPISNLPVFSKVFERLTLSRMLPFIDKYNLLSNSQFGFRKDKSITHAAIKLTTAIVDAYHLRYFSACFFLDLRKAFDTIDHNLLLAKLDHMGFRGHFNSYMESYLSRRKQFVQVGNYRSKQSTIMKGVPQGSILGPILFCLYINDIIDAVDIEVVLFADDAAFIIIAPTLQQLYSKITKLFSDLQRYLAANKLVPNLEKSKLMSFSSHTIPPMQEMKFNNQAIEWVNEYKYLGLMLNNKMTYSLHIENVANRVSRFSGIFFSLRHILPFYVLKLLYHSFVLPHLLLHIELWGSAPEYWISKVRVRVNTLLRLILCVQYVDGRPVISNTDLYKKIGVLNLNSLFKMRMLKLLLSLLGGKVPSLYNVLLEPHESHHTYATRRGIFRHPYLTCEIERRAVSHQLILLHEEIPEGFDNMSITRALKKYKTILYQNQ